MKINAAVPLFFSWQRYLLLTAGLCCLYLLRSGSWCYEVRTDLTGRRQWLLTVVCIAIQLLFFRQMLQWNTGALTWPDYMEHHQQYYRLTEALLEGHVDLGRRMPCRDWGIPMIRRRGQRRALATEILSGTKPIITGVIMYISA